MFSYQINFCFVLIKLCCVPYVLLLYFIIFLPSHFVLSSLYLYMSFIFICCCILFCILFLILLFLFIFTCFLFYSIGSICKPNIQAQESEAQRTCADQYCSSKANPVLHSSPAHQTATGQLAFSFLLPRRRAPHALHSSCMRFCFLHAQTDDPTLHDSIRSARKSRHGLTCMQFPFTLHTSAASIAQPSSLHAGSPWPPHVATLQHTGLFPPRGRRLHVILHSHAAKVSC